MDELDQWRRDRWLRRLSKNTGIDYESVWAWANGKRKPTLASMEKLIDGMGYELVIRKRNDGRRKMPR